MAHEDDVLAWLLFFHRGVGWGVMTFVVDGTQDDDVVFFHRGVGGCNDVHCSSWWMMHYSSKRGPLKTWMGVGRSVSDKKFGDRFMCDSIPSLVYQWMWRQTVLPCAPTKFMQELVRLLKA